jgi:broad specificity phosphatase PhoE
VPTVLLARHAQASFGAADYDVLSERGRAQVAALLEGLRRRGIVPARVVSGASRRHRDTAGPCAAAAAVDVALDARWNEYDDADILTHHSASGVRVERRPGDDVPAVSSRRFQEILNDALRKWIGAGASTPCRQAWPVFRARVAAALAELAADLTSGQSALVVSSGGTIAALSASLLGLPAQAFVTLNHVAVNAAITKVVLGRSGATLVSYNEHSHLEEAPGDLVSYR